MDLENIWPIALAFILYLVLMMSIGLYYSRRQKNLSSYILGDRQLGPWLTSMSAEASDMSGWMLMGLPGVCLSSWSVCVLDGHWPHYRHLGELGPCVPEA